MNNSKKAFTLIELVFVIVVIGILAAVALPKLAMTRDEATITKAKTTVASVRNSLSIQRQKLILSGLFQCTNPKLGNNDNIFDTFSYSGPNTDDCPKDDLVLNYAMPKCNGSDRGCWVMNGTKYSYRLPSSTDVVDFVIENNRFVCDSSKELCSKLE
ncbi:Type II secretion envelope pseudopilin protein (PulG,guides folded protein to PulD in outer membrane) [hydrothermal vent metagenome]|uniref:Type II secretion envelope pseudopilin protein (PulG,guides folded protein to PulD in outer membrane) n=1 Tax=hydrothermal vent metagenome TaxID=652676 RepID=A0A1W1EJ77_9ZZZZ